MNTNNTENNTNQRGYGSNAFHNIKSFFEDKLASEEAEKKLRQSIKEGVIHNPMLETGHFLDEKNGRSILHSPIYAEITEEEFESFLDEAEEYWEEIKQLTQPEIHLNSYANNKHGYSKWKLLEIADAREKFKDQEKLVGTYFADDLKQQFQKL